MRGKNASKSRRKFKELFPDQIKLRIRFSLDNLKLDGDVMNIPLFMADQADQLIGLALEQRHALEQAACAGTSGMRWNSSTACR